MFNVGIVSFSLFQQEEPKTEEVKPKEKKEEEKPPVEEKKDDEPKPPPPFVLFMNLHCVGCAKKIERSLLRIPGILILQLCFYKHLCNEKH